MLANFYYMVFLHDNHFSVSGRFFMAKILYHLSFMAVCWGVVMAMRGNIDSSFLIVLACIHIFVTFINFFISFENPTFMSNNNGLLFLEALQILWICLKLNSPETHASWYIVLLFYLIFAYICLVVAIFVGMMMIVTIKMGTYNTREQIQLALIRIGVFSYLIVTLLILFFWVTGTVMLLDAKVIGLKVSGSPGPVTSRLYVAGILMIIGGVAGLLIGTLFYIYLRELIVQHLGPAGAT